MPLTRKVAQPCGPESGPVGVVGIVQLSATCDKLSCFVLVLVILIPVDSIAFDYDYEYEYEHRYAEDEHESYLSE